MTRPPVNDRGFGVYVHWPFCARICPYCDFNVVRDRGRTAEKTDLVQAILADLAAHAALIGPRRLASIFFGGGTPSLMEPAWVAAIVERATALWPIAADLEVTLEANPTDAERRRFEAFRSAGVNRLSLGVQSLDGDALTALGRNHDAVAARRGSETARQVFDRLSVDLIYARPGQTLAAWTAELHAVVALGPEHVSPYQLTIETGTAFDRAVRRGSLHMPPADLSADFYEATQTVLSAAGFEAYEVSNPARGAAARSRHNLIYWRGGDYVGVGPGAHGRLTVDGIRRATAAPNRVADYVARVRESGAASLGESMAPRDAALERLLMGLRTVEGVALDDLLALDIPGPRIADLAGLVEAAQGRLIATARGRPVLDRVIATLAGA